MISHEPSEHPNAQCTDIDEGSGAFRPIARRGRPSLEEAQRLPARILEAGWEVLAEQGFEKFTFDRIARHARIGKVTIYNRFPGKPEFLAALLKYKVEQRRMSIIAMGDTLPLVERFCQRAAAVVKTLLSPEGVLMERLVDWCDQEFSDDDFNYRLAMYQEALVLIQDDLHRAVSDEGIVIRDPGLAARFWVEGLLGHVRFVGSLSPYDRDETERWARNYSEFFFAALCGWGASIRSASAAN